MATASPCAAVLAQAICSLSPTFPRCSPFLYPTPITSSSSGFVSPNSVALRAKKQRSLPLSSLFHNPKTRKSRSAPTVVAAQSNFLRVIQTVWKVGKDGVDAGIGLVPVSIPRPIARVSVTVALLTVSFIVLKSFLSTAFFALATMGLVYFLFIAFNKEEGPKGGTNSDASTFSSEDEALEEARRIMEKYKK
ncbi:unnamed protein product [Linum trigynum]|uniref:Uncharacterized protein n=1 Tax=Linum trigynum TaxID=586398 RepID=A0AAV2GPA0_9ROSI